MEGFIMSHNRREFLKTLSGVAAGLALVQWPSKLLAENNLIRFTVLHTNDIHCHLDPFPANDPQYGGRGGLARMAALIDRFRQQQPNMLLLDAGDMFQGTPYFNYYKGDLITKVMSEMGYDASTIGNHEFDNGLEGMEKGLENAKYPVISSNYNFSSTILADRFPDFVIFHRKGIKIGVYALGIELKGLVNPKSYGNTIYQDPVQQAQKMESLLKKEKHCDLIFCLSHLGYEYRQNSKISDRLLVPHTSYTDMIIGGHTHTFLPSPVKLKNACNEQVIVNQVGWAGCMLGKIDFFLDADKKQVLYSLGNNFGHSLSLA